MPQAHIIVSGHVQGVFFRMTAQKEAIQRNLKGWVRNLPNGQVEIIASGNKTILDGFILWCHNGPPHSYVDNIQIEWMSNTKHYENFKIKY